MLEVLGAQPLGGGGLNPLQGSAAQPLLAPGRSQTGQDIVGAAGTLTLLRPAITQTAQDIVGSKQQAVLAAPQLSATASSEAHAIQNYALLLPEHLESGTVTSRATQNATTLLLAAAASAQVVPRSIENKTLAADANAGAGTVQLHGSEAKTLAPLTAQSAGGITTFGAADQLLPLLQQSSIVFVTWSVIYVAADQHLLAPLSYSLPVISTVWPPGPIVTGYGNSTPRKAAQSIQLPGLLLKVSAGRVELHGEQNYQLPPDQQLTSPIYY